MRMFQPDEFKDRVRNSVNIVRVISDYVSLKKRGKNYLALCPFHSEKTPSFNVSEEKQIFHCFGCSVGGDVFKFVMLIEHVQFPDALKSVAMKNGIPLPKGTAEKPKGAEPEERDQLFGVLEEACKFFHKTLFNGQEGKVGLNYLAEREISNETIERFRLGFAPSSGDQLYKHLSSIGVPPGLMERSGLVRKSENQSGYYDYFRGRITFPILDVSGRLIAFGGRRVGTALPKYLNSPDTLVYNKGKNLFGLSFAKETVKHSNFVVLVEGYLDFLVPYQFGTHNIVASLGTGLTEHQVKLLGRYTRNVVVNYDADVAGLAAAKRSVELFLREGFKVNVALLPEGKDPDLYVRAHGLDKYRQVLKDSVPYIEFVAYAALRSERNLASPKAKINVLNSVLPYLAQVTNKIERAAYASRIAQRINLEDGLILSELKKAVEARKTKIESTMITPSEIKPAEGKLLRSLLDNSSSHSEVLSKLKGDDFEGLRTEKIFRAIISLFLDQRDIDFANLETVLEEEEISLLIKVYFQQESVGTTLPEVLSYVNAIKRGRLEMSIKHLQTRIAEAEQQHDEEQLIRFYEEKREVTQQLFALYEG